MKPNLFASLLGMLTLLCTPFAFSQQIVGPEIVGGFKPAKVMLAKPVALEPFPGQEAMIQELYELLEFDLQFSGVFLVGTESEYPQANYQFRTDRERRTIDYISWRTVTMKGPSGADLPLDYIIVTEIKPRGGDQFSLHLLVYDVFQGQRSIGRAYGGEPHPGFPKDAMRRAGHKATAEIITTLTNGREVPITESRIAFVNEAPGGTSKEVFIIDYDGWKGSLQQITFFNSSTIFPDWSPSGDQLAYVSLKDDWADSFIHDLNTGEIKALAKFKGTNTTPRWAPDGEHLAISLSAEGNPEIYLMSKEGGKPKKRLTHHPDGDISPDISPSGDLIAFTSDRIGSPKIYVSDIEGANPRRLTFLDRKCDTPFWSPIAPPWPAFKNDNDLRIAFCGFYDSLQGDIYTIKPDGADLRMVTDGRSDNKNPTWSPNARFIAFSSNRGGKFDIYIARSDASNNGGGSNLDLPNGERFYRVTYIAGNNLQPSWSPN